MKTVNRTVLTVTPKKPFIDWANSFEDDDLQLELSDPYSTAYLIPDDYDEMNYDKFIRKQFATIFAIELGSWITDPDHWPKDRSCKIFREWFSVKVTDTVIDLGSGKIVHEVY